MNREVRKKMEAAKEEWTEKQCKNIEKRMMLGNSSGLQHPEGSNQNPTTKDYITAKNNVQSVSYLFCTQVIKPQITHKPQNQS